MNRRLHTPRDETVLVLAPVGKDAELAAAAIAKANLSPKVCKDLTGVVEEVRRGCGVLLLAEEALAPIAMPDLLECLGQQPPWSDIPIVLITSGGSVPEGSRSALDLFSPLSNVTVLERPFRVITLTSALHAALRARRRQYEVRNLLEQRDQVLTSIQDAYIMLDQDWRYTYANQQACELYQLPAEKLLGLNIWDIFPDARDTEFETNLRIAMAERVARNFEWHQLRGDRWFSVRVYPADGGLALFTVEVTERKRMETILQESEHRLHLALDSSDLGTWYCDLPFGTLLWDQTCKRHYGLSSDTEVTFELLFSIVHPEDRAGARQTVLRAIARCSTYDDEYRVVHGDDSVHWIHAIGRVFCTDAGEPFRFDGITIDITDRKRTELELERARREAIDASLAKDQFLAALSHELRTPLSPVLMTVASLKGDPGLTDGLRKDMEMIHRQVELEARLIDDLLDLTRITRGKLILSRDVLDLHELIRHAIITSCNDEVAQKRLNVDCKLEAKEHHTFGDPARLQQILWNLLNNAIKFTPADGRITVSTRNPGEGQIEIAVTDSGIGIHPEVLPRLFDAFEQGNVGITRRFGGLGLGLAISKAIADMHEGSLSARSDGRGEGSTFVLQLSTSAPAEPGAAPAVQGISSPARSLHVLLVEDHEPTRGVLVRLFQRAGHRVQAAGTVAEALTLASETSFDMVVSDLGLPDASGLELMRELSARHRLQGIALSGFGMEEDVKASADAGFAVHLTKPVDWRRLEAALASFAPEERREAETARREG